SRALATTWMLSIESPPNSKKFSLTPTPFTPNTSSHTRHNTSSFLFPGPTYLPFPPSPLSPFSTRGNPFRSSFPFAVTGILSNSTYTPGTMCSGSFLNRYSRHSCLLSPPPLSSPLSSPSPFFSRLTTYATSFFSSPPSPSSCTTTAACSTPSCPSNAPSISPTSIRYPLTFTCPSFLPTNSTSPSSFHFTKSPVRYNLPPPSLLPSPLSPANTSGTNRSAVHSPRFTYPLPTPAPPIHNSPTTPTGTGSISSSTTYTRTFPNGLPKGTLPSSSSLLTLFSLSPPLPTSYVSTPTVVSVGP